MIFIHGQPVRPELAISHTFQGAVFAQLPQGPIRRRWGNAEAFAQVRIADQCIILQIIQYKLPPEGRILRVLAERFFLLSTRPCSITGRGLAELTRRRKLYIENIVDDLFSRSRSCASAFPFYIVL